MYGVNTDRTENKIKQFLIWEWRLNVRVIDFRVSIKHDFEFKNETLLSTNVNTNVILRTHRGIDKSLAS